MCMLIRLLPEHADGLPTEHLSITPDSEIGSNVGIAMGNYYFTDATTGKKSKVEYTFGYTRCDDGKVRIFLHHSSVPYAVAAAPAPSITKEGDFPEASPISPRNDAMIGA